MDSLDMNWTFYKAATKARRMVFGLIIGVSLDAEDAIWDEWDATYCMGGEL